MKQLNIWQVEKEQAPTNAAEIIDSYTLFENEVEKKYKRTKEKSRVLVYKVTDRLIEDNIDITI